MPLKSAGNATGFYYIPVAGLPWNTTWQTLKDFVRNHPDGTYLNVERAHVYQNHGVAATDGYVCIRGSEHFHKAMAFLQGARLENQYLMVIGSNETSTINLRDDELPLPSTDQPSKSAPSSSSKQWPPGPQSSSWHPSYHSNKELAVSLRTPTATSSHDNQIPPSPTWSEAQSTSFDGRMYAFCATTQCPSSPAMEMSQYHQQHQSSPPLDAASHYLRGPSTPGMRSATPQIAYGSHSPDLSDDSSAK